MCKNTCFPERFGVLCVADKENHSGKEEKLYGKKGNED